MRVWKKICYNQVPIVLLFINRSHKPPATKHLRGASKSHIDRKNRCESAQNSWGIEKKYICPARILSKFWKKYKVSVCSEFILSFNTAFFSHNIYGLTWGPTAFLGRTVHQKKHRTPTLPDHTPSWLLRPIQTPTTITPMQFPDTS